MTSDASGRQLQNRVDFGAHLGRSQTIGKLPFPLPHYLTHRFFSLPLEAGPPVPL